MDIIIITILLITTLLSFVAFYIAFSDHLKIRKNKVQLYQNKVHFYIARDKNSDLVWLYLGKPIRNVFYECWTPQYISLYSECYFERVGLNKNNYKDLKWEDEPVEVFLNLGD